jgi:aspartyl protease family protein
MKGRQTFRLPIPSVTQFAKNGPRFLMVVGLLGLCSSIAFADSNDLRSRLERLAADGNFAVAGLERIEPETMGEEHGSISERLSFLLQNYNHVLIQDERGSISKVLITSRKAPDDTHWAESATTVHTVRMGSRHQVEAAIAGPNGVIKTVSLMVDTGATTLALPESMIGELGFAAADLRCAIARTANGLARTLDGTLNTVSVGAASAENVKVSFVPDQKLGRVMLLGMSFLQRFRMTIDNERNELLLLAK